MASYRFCRPDDIPLIVRALNECWVVHFPGMAPVTEEGFRTEIKEQSIWVSNAMVALAGSDPVALCVGTKRETEVLIQRVGVKPGHQRQGHAGHILTSLSQKLAVLGPPRLVAEVPEEVPAALPFFESLGYEREEVLTDFERPAGARRPVPAELLVLVTVAELAADGVLEVPEDAPWERSRQTLEQSRDSLRGMGFVSLEGLEAYLFYRYGLQGTTDILAMGSCSEESSGTFLGLLVEHLARITSTPLRLPKLLPGEVSPELLAAMGFTAGARYHRCSATATPV